MRPDVGPGQAFLPPGKLRPNKEFILPVPEKNNNRYGKTEIILSKKNRKLHIRLDKKTITVVSERGQNMCGGIAQLGERLNGIQEVSGSIPLTSTKKIQASDLCQMPFLLPPKPGRDHLFSTALCGLQVGHCPPRTTIFTSPGCMRSHTPLAHFGQMQRIPAWTRKTKIVAAR